MRRRAFLVSAALFLMGIKRTTDHLMPRNQIRVSINSPTNNSAVASGSLVMSGIASSNKQLKNVQVRVGTGVWTTATGTTSWTATVTIPTIAGSITLYARATDVTGAMAMANVTVTVLAQDTTAPTVTITSPAANATVTGSIPVTGTAADVGVGVDTVEVAVDSGTYTAAAGTSSWSYMLDTSPLTAAAHQIHARSTDLAGNESAIASVAVTVTHPANYPASYFTGPLGVNNIVPADPSGYMSLIYGGVTGNTATQQRAFIQQRMTDSGRSFDCVSGQLTLSDLSNGDTFSTGGSGGRGELWIHSLGSIPCFSMPGNWGPGEVAAGLHDADLSLLAARFSAFPYRVMFRLWREQNSQSGQKYFTGDGTTTVATGGSAGSTSNLATIASSWIAGWRYFVDYFRANGATNVGFCWCPSELANRNNTVSFTGRNQLLATYPGDTYVDWVGIDRYNRGLNGGNSTPLHTGWAEFDELFNYRTLGYQSGNNPAITDEYGPRKPIVIFETGSKYDNTTGHASRKADWFRHIDSVCKPHIPYLHGVQFFDQWVSSEGNDWLVDENQVSGGDARGTVDATTYQGWKDLQAIGRFNVGAAGGAT